MMMSSTYKEYKNIKQQLKFINQYSLLAQEHEICGKISDMLIIGKYALTYAIDRMFAISWHACLVTASASDSVSLLNVRTL